MIDKVKFRRENMMRKLSKKDMEEIRDICNRGCDYAATQDIVTEIANETLKECGCELCQVDDATIVDWDDDTVCTVEDFANEFWDKAVEKILNVVETQN